MKRGHVLKTPKVRPQDSAWYQEIEEANIQRIEREWAAQQQQAQQKGA